MLNRGSVMNRHRPRITDCMDCWQHKHCFLFYENWKDGEPRGFGCAAIALTGARWRSRDDGILGFGAE